MDSSSVIFLFAAVIIVAAIIIAIITLIRRGGGHLNVDKYRSKWMAIEQSHKRDNPDTSMLAILNADKLVDQALRDRCIKGSTMGERLKSAHDVWSNRNALWNAHKLRNQIAHETDAKINYDQARTALAGYKRALKDLGAI